MLAISRGWRVVLDAKFVSNPRVPPVMALRQPAEATVTGEPVLLVKEVVRVYDAEAFKLTGAVYDP
jgi:hypothetical protein